jgi:hypothetical protein
LCEKIILEGKTSIENKDFPLIFKKRGRTYERYNLLKMGGKGMLGVVFMV